MAESWKISLPCTRAEAETLAEDNLFISSSDCIPTIVTREIDPKHSDDWAIDIYCETKPDPQFLQNILELSPSAKASKIKPKIERLGDEDWVTMSQQGLEPMRAGRFHVHTSNNPPLNDPRIINISIDAGQAFGTGHHETTAGCLETMDLLKRRGRHFRNIIDVGTGAGLLAFAAHGLWPSAKIIASDIDPIAVEVSRGNAAINAIPSGDASGAIHFLVSNGLDHVDIQRRAPYDLIIANILAGPLVALAPQISAAAKPGTTLILAGLLRSQKQAVTSAYIRAGFRLRRERLENEWPCLMLVKARKYAPARTNRRARSPLASDYFGEC